MRIDFYFIPLHSDNVLTKEILEERVPSDMTLSRVIVDDAGAVTSFEITEGEVVAEFHFQDDKTWWHPMSAEEEQAELALVERVMHYLNFEYDLEKMG